MHEIADNIRLLGPTVLVIWTVTVASVIIWPQKYRNSILLMIALMVTLIFLSGFFADQRGYFLMACFLLIALGLFLVPIVLIINGIQLIRKESLSLSHLLSIGLGVIVAIGEIATVAYVFYLAGNRSWEITDRLVLALAMTVFYFSALILSFVIYSLFLTAMPRIMNFDYIIIHGCALKADGSLTRLLQNRVDKAIEVYNKCPDKPVIIASGGQGADEKVSEAQAMRDYLLLKGIPYEKIIMEDQSTTTRENLLHCRKIIEEKGQSGRIALVSSNYHVYRCLRLARDIGLRCTGIGAPVALYYWPTALIREFIAIFVTRSFLIWSMLGYLLFISPLLLTLLTG
jgi:uncharacterized SAM-binding protein YcdF (DUF218 family)